MDKNMWMRTRSKHHLIENQSIQSLLPFLPLQKICIKTKEFTCVMETLYSSAPYLTLNLLPKLFLLFKKKLLPTIILRVRSCNTDKFQIHNFKLIPHHQILPTPHSPKQQTTTCFEGSYMYDPLAWGEVGTSGWWWGKCGSLWLLSSPK